MSPFGDAKSIFFLGRGHCPLPAALDLSTFPHCLLIPPKPKGSGKSLPMRKGVAFGMKTGMEMEIMTWAWE